MNRIEFKKYFKTTGPVILPVIHAMDEKQVCRNINIAIQQGAQGVFLINHDFSVDQFLPIIKSSRARFPTLWLGVNFLGVTGKDAFPVLADLAQADCLVDAYWADNACVDERIDPAVQVEAEEIDRVRNDCGWQGLYFAGTAFKKQREVDPGNYAAAARIAAQHCDVVTTSGVATGQKAALGKISAFRNALSDTPLALASGVNPENVHQYARDTDAILVATGINVENDFYNIDANRLGRLLDICRSIDTDIIKSRQPLSADDRENRWYLAMMAPRSRGEKYAWLDPSSAYINSDSFHAILDDLLEPFDAADIDVVAGFDAAGFVLGAAMAARLGRGFLTIRKGGKIPVDYDSVPMTNYSGQTEALEMRKPAFAAGTRVLLVDQWIETGGTMSAGISLVERQDGIVAGIAAVCVEENEVTARMRQKFKMASCVVPGSAVQSQCNQQDLESFTNFKPEDTFPAVGTKKL